MLARIWLIEKGDICNECTRSDVCHNHSKCLHLVASAGRSINDKDKCVVSISGNYRRFPIFAKESDSVAPTGKVGFIGGVILSRGNELLLDLPNRESMFTSQSSQNHDIINYHIDKILTYTDLKQLGKENIIAALNKADWRVSGSDGA